MEEPREISVTTIEAVILGMMLSWTPCVLLMTCLLWRAPFEPDKYKDQYQESMQAMIEAKRQGQEIAEAPHPKLAPVIDLMEALKKSIAEKQPTTSGGKKPPVRAVPAAQAEAQAPEKKRKKSSAG